MPHSLSPSVTPLFPAHRVKRELIVTHYGRTGETAYEIVKVVGSDGIERLVQRSCPLTGLGMAASVRQGA